MVPGHRVGVRFTTTANLKDLYAEQLADYFRNWLLKNSHLHTTRRDSIRIEEAKPDAALVLALHMMDSHAYAGHDDPDSLYALVAAADMD